MNSKNLRGLCEAYSAIYDNGFDGWVSSIIEEGYDLSDYTWDEVYEAYEEYNLDEETAEERAIRIARNDATKEQDRRAFAGFFSGIGDQLQRRFRRPTEDELEGRPLRKPPAAPKPGAGEERGEKKDDQKTKPPANRPLSPTTTSLNTPGVQNLFIQDKQSPGSSPPPAPPPGGGNQAASSGTPRPAGPVLSKKDGVEGTGVGKDFKARAFTAAEKSRYASVAAQNAARTSAPSGGAQTRSTPLWSGSGPSLSAKPAPTTPPKPPTPAIGKLGNTPFERRTPTSAELRAAERARKGGASPEQALQAAQKTNLPTTGPTPAVPDLGSVGRDLAKANTEANLNKPAPAGSALRKYQENNPNYKINTTTTPTAAQITKASQGITPKKPPTPMNNSFSWGSASKLVDDIADAYSSIYEAKKKVDQDQDGDNDFADISIARMIASGVPKEVAIAKVRGKAYNKEVEIDEAAVNYTTGRTKSGLSPVEKTALKLIQHRLSNSPKDQIRADQQELVDRNMTDAIKKTPKRRLIKVGPIASKRFKNAAMRKRGVKVSSVPIKTVPGLKDANRQTGINADFELWVNELLYEGYDLSDYTWDEVYEAYLNEGVLGRRGVSLRPASERTESALTSSQRASRARKAKKKQEEQEKQKKLKARADNIIAQLTGSGRRPSRTSTSRAPEQKAPAPSADDVTSKHKPGEKTDRLAANAAEVIRDLQSQGLEVHKKGAEVLKQIQQNADFNLWIGELLDEGYTLENWTIEDLYDLYEEILEEKYSRA